MPPERSPMQLLVEGRDDQWSIINLMRRHGVDWDDAQRRLPFVRDCKGVEKLLDIELSLIVSNKSAYTTIGVVLDADMDCRVRWNKVRRVLVAHGFPCPPDPVAEGFVAADTAGIARAGVWLMPDNTLPGMLEDFLGTLIPQGDGCWRYCDAVVDEAKRRGAPFTPNDRTKAKIHSWLAWREEPGIPFGQALTARCFNADTALALAFVAWFHRLYGP